MKKIQEVKNFFSALFLAKSGMRQAEKERNEFWTPIPLIPDPEEKIPKKNSKKIQKIKKQLSVIIFSKNGIR